MEYQITINLLDNTPNQPTKLRKKDQVQVTDNLCGTYNTKSQIKFKTSMLKSGLCDQSNAYILLKGIITVEQVLAPAEPDNNGKEAIYKNCAPFINKQYTNK